MSTTAIIILQVGALFCVAGVVFFFGYQARKAQNELIAHIRARYPKWVIEFKSDGSTQTHQVNSKEEHEALEARLKS